MAFIYLVAQQPPDEEEIIAAISPGELHANGYYKKEKHCLCNYIVDNGNPSGIWYRLKTCTCYGY